MKNIFNLLFNPQVRINIDKNLIKVIVNGELVSFPMIMHYDSFSNHPEQFKEKFINAFKCLLKNNLKFSLVQPSVEIELLGELALQDYGQLFVDIFKEPNFCRRLFIVPGKKHYVRSGKCKISQINNTYNIKSRRKEAA